MNREFFEEVAKKATELTSPEYTFSVQDNVKNNVVVIGIMVHKKGSNISPVIYLGEEETNVASAIDSLFRAVVQAYKDIEHNPVDLKMLESFE